MMNVQISMISNLVMGMVVPMEDRKALNYQFYRKDFDLFLFRAVSYTKGNDQYPKPYNSYNMP